MDRFWSVLFGAVLLGCFLLCAIAPFVGWWLPPMVSSYGGEVDRLFYVILGLTTFFFVLPSTILVYCMYRYRHREGHKAIYTHGNHRLELLWTAVPAAILLFIAFAQVQAWEKIKYQSRMPPPDQVVQVTARQWEWRIRYPYAAKGKTLVPVNAPLWAEMPEFDDVRGVNDLHTWKGGNLKIYLKTNDVIHSFGFPNLRLMQDALPGKTIPMWLNVTESNCEFDPATKQLKVDDAKDKTWEIACKELCGGRHYAMKGHLYVHKTEESYRDWLEHQSQLQESRKPDVVPSADPMPAALAEKP